MGSDARGVSEGVAVDGWDGETINVLLINSEHGSISEFYLNEYKENDVGMHAVFFSKKRKITIQFFSISKLLLLMVIGKR